MRRLHARKGMALAMLPALLLAAGGCAKTPAAPVSREAAALTWTIVDEAGGVGRGDFTGKARGKRNEPFAVLAEQGFIYAGLIMEAVQKALGDKANQIMVPLVVLRQ